MQTAVTEAFRRIRRNDAIMDIYLRAGDSKGPGPLQMQDDYGAFARLPATAPRDVTLKAAQAIASYKASGNDRASEIARAFFRQRAPRDGAWLNQLRDLIAILQMIAPDDTYALTCLRSIVAGLGKPRLV